MLVVIFCHIRYFELRICPEEQVGIVFINVLLIVNIEIRHARDITVRKC